MVGSVKRRYYIIRLFTLVVIFYSLAGHGQLNTSLINKDKQANDSIVIAANTSYSKASFLRRALMGNNYRKEWAQPVKMPVFHIKRQGFTAKEMGGGQQTTSLQMVDERGKAWVLRSVDKKVKDVALPKNLRFPLAIRFLQDMISASHPYAALSVGSLAQAAGVIAPKPRLYFVPDDPDLGAFRKQMSSKMFFLEQREPTPDGSETDKTDKVMAEIIEENDHLILQEQVLKARLLDMLVADWDRHEDQWRWGSFKFSGDKYYYAIPRDRDQAFFQTNGLLPRFIKIFGMKHIGNFRNESKNLKNLNLKSWLFDKTFLNELDAATWERAIKRFAASLPDSVIDKAVKNLPQEIYAMDGKALTRKLISRRNSLLPNAMKYYKFISRTVHVSGTAESELFEIAGINDSLTISMYRLKDGNKGAQIYQRTFNPGETSMIYLEGLEGNDKFVLGEQTNTRIKLKIHGGKGGDTYDLKGKTKALVEDSIKDKDILLHQGSAKIRLH